MKQVFDTFVENLLVLVHFPTYLLELFINFNYVNQNATQKRPIILVERWFIRNTFHIIPKKYLERRGFKVYCINHTLFRGDFVTAAEDLKKFIEKCHLSHVVLVGISGGAATCMEYLQNHEGWEHTDLFISIAGPLNGSPRAKLLPIFSVKELEPESKFLHHLYSQKIKHPEKIVTIEALRDNMVPTKYSHLPGIKNVQLNVSGHNFLHTFWIPTYRLVADLAAK